MHDDIGETRQLASSNQASKVHLHTNALPKREKHAALRVPKIHLTLPSVPLTKPNDINGII